jgi:hypothetical protein
MNEPCYCGADDCRACNPGNFVRRDERWVFIGDEEGEEKLDSVATIEIAH